MANLSTEQVLLLNNLMYMQNKEPFSGITQYPNPTTIENIINSIDVSMIQDKTDYGNMTTGAEWKQMLEAIRSNPQLMKVQLTSTHIDTAGGGGEGVSALFADPSTGEAIVTFCGTAEKEWKDNFVAGGEVSSAQQENALDWYQSLDLEQYDSVTVTGHSKGGNKAKYITIMDDSVDRCVSFDGQGFSDEFMEENQNNIYRNQGKIENHNLDYDYVNLLLNDVGNTTFYEGQQIGGFLENHCPNSFFDFTDGTLKMNETSRPEEMKALDEFLNKLLRSVSDEEKDKLLNVIGDLVQEGFGGASIGELIEIALAGDNEESVATLLALVIKYGQDSLMNIFEKWGLSNFIEVVETITNSWYFEYIKTLTELPYWLIKVIKEVLKEKLGIELVDNLIIDFLTMISMIPGKVYSISIAESGKDKKVTTPVKGTVNLALSESETLSVIQEFEEMARKMEQHAQEAESTAKRLNSSLFSIRSIMTNQANQIRELCDKQEKMAAVLKEIVRQYETTEEKCKAI